MQEKNQELTVSKTKVVKVVEKPHFTYEQKLEIFTNICEKLSEGIPPHVTITKSGVISYGTFHNWKNKEEGFADLLERAYEINSENLFQKHKEINELEPMINPTTGGVDSGWVSWQKTRQQAIQWQAGVTQPKKFGNKVDVEAKISIQPITGMEIL